MAKKDKRVRKLSGSLNNDILKIGEWIAMILGVTEEQFVAEARINKLHALVRVYGVTNENTTQELLDLSLCLAEEFVKGFRAVDQITRPKNRPKSILPSDWADLFKLVDEHTARGQSINQACKSIVGKHELWSKYKYTSLAATYRRERTKLNRLVGGDESELVRSGYSKKNLLQMFEASRATAARTKVNS